MSGGGTELQGHAEKVTDFRLNQICNVATERIGL